jgi:hypothetical protein
MQTPSTAGLCSPKPGNRISPIQLPGEKICGQVAVELITGKPLYDIITLFGHTHSTRTRELVRVLNLFGYKTSKKLRRIHPPALAIGKMVWRAPGTGVRRPGSHWVVTRNGRTYDGYADIDHVEALCNGQVTSWLEIIAPCAKCHGIGRVECSNPFFHEVCPDCGGRS